jgi:uncharacterized protein (DUF488 family)
MTVFTIGYEGLKIDDFMSLVTGHGVQTVVDVRQLPLSRKRGFSKTALAETLKRSGVDYAHMVSLGCPRSVRDAYRADGNWGRYTVGFMAHLRTQADAIAQLAELAQASRCALLCFEADFNLCHRSMVAEAVRDKCGMQVYHIPVKVTEAEDLHLAFA